MGIYKEIQSIGRTSVDGYIAALRLQQGEDDLAELSDAECREIINKWQSLSGGTTSPG